MKRLIEELQFLPPWNEDTKFEKFMTSYFNELEKTFSYDRFGRLGQKQDGLDIYSAEKKTVVQCKLKFINGGNDENIRKDLIQELDRDFNSFLEYNKANKLKYNKFILASTFKNDTQIATECSKKTDESIKVEYWCWEKIKDNMPEIIFKIYYKDYINFLEENNIKDSFLYTQSTEYIQDVNTIDFILLEENPTKNQANFILKLIKSDANYKRYFYSKLDSKNWFNILNNNEEFNYSINSFWESLMYLERISIQNKQSEATELIEEIINIVKTVSKNQHGNYWTYYKFIKILINLPNENIPIEILEYIPIWLGSKNDTMIQSSEICQNLLPKFLNDAPSILDIKKSEVIIKHLFYIEKGDSYIKESEHIEGKYYSKVYLNSLKTIFTNKLILERIANNCSKSILIELANNIKKLRFDFPKGINITIKIDAQEFHINTLISNSDLQVKISSGNQIEKPNIIIADFDNLNKNDLKKLYINIFNENNISINDSIDNTSNIDSLVNDIFHGSYYEFLDSSISQLNDNYYYGESTNEVFSLIFRDLLNQKVKTNTEVAKKLLNEFSFNNKYRLPFFQRVVLFIIGENWNLLKNLFIEIISENDKKKIFSDYEYQNDLFELLDKNQEKLEVNELNEIQKIIDFGPQEDNKERYENYSDYWRLRWYSALRKLSKYSDLYSSLSIKLGKTYEDFDYKNKIRFSSGESSPMTIEEILSMTNEKIVKYIDSFKPNDVWEEPTISGFSSIIQKAIEIEPIKFSNEIEIYNNIYYIYAYKMANGFRDAWKNKRTFDWEKVLYFFQAYIQDTRFKNGQFALENDRRSATSDWVVGAIAELLTEGMQSDSNAFNKELLTIAKNILVSLVDGLEPKNNSNDTNTDYPTYALNSTAGKVIRASLDYALRIGRNDFPKESKIKWENDTKSLFELAFKKNILDCYILSGWHFQQFYFLDKDWIIAKINTYQTIEEKYWLAFIGGFTFSNPPFNKTVYKLLYPHYERAIKSNLTVKSHYDNGIIQHIVAFYFWGYEDLNNKGLLYLIIKNNNHESILKLVNFIWRQTEYILRLNEEEFKRYEKMIFELWTVLSNKYENTDKEEEEKVLLALSNLLEFAPELNEDYTNLLLKSTKVTGKDYHFYNLVENISKKKDKGEPNVIAKHIGFILNSIKFPHYFSSIDNEHVINLVEFLYQNNQKVAANEFCNNMAKQGCEFLKEVFSNNNKKW